MKVFTLVELAVVLVILGLVLGGVMIVQDLTGNGPKKAKQGYTEPKRDC